MDGGVVTKQKNNNIYEGVDLIQCRELLLGYLRSQAKAVPNLLPSKPVVSDIGNNFTGKSTVFMKEQI